jgi:sugar lactone lactonase YvrE
VFADMTSKIDGLADRMKVDAMGNVYTTGPGRIWIFHRTVSISARSLDKGPGDQEAHWFRSQPIASLSD